MSDRQKDALIRWVIFGLGLGLVPVAFAYIARALADVKLAHPIGQGDLFLLSAIVAFSGLGSLFGRGKRGSRLALAVGGIAMIDGLMGALLYASVSNATHSHGGVVLWVSVVMYAVSAVSGGACVVLAEA